MRRLALPPSDPVIRLGAVRLTDFWERMETRFGARYAESVARDQVLRQLDGLTVVQALDAGWSVKSVWRAVCEAFEIPAKER